MYIPTGVLILLVLFVLSRATRDEIEDLHGLVKFFVITGLVLLAIAGIILVVVGILGGTVALGYAWIKVLPHITHAIVKTVGPWPILSLFGAFFLWIGWVTWQDSRKSKLALVATSSLNDHPSVPSQIEVDKEPRSQANQH